MGDRLMNRRTLLGMMATTAAGSLAGGPSGDLLGATPADAGGEHEPGRVPGPRRGRSLLVVFDDEEPRRDLHGLTPPRGWAAIRSTTTREALALLDRGTVPDGLVLGLSRPDGPGEVVLRRVREGRLETLTAVCAWPLDVEGLERLRDLLPTARPAMVLVKPLDKEAIRDVCRRWSGVVR